MGKNVAKRGYKVRGKKVIAEPSNMAEEVEVSEFSTAEVDAAEGSSGHRTRAEDTARGVSVCDTVRKTKKTVKKTRGQPPPKSCPVGLSLVLSRNWT